MTHHRRLLGAAFMLAGLIALAAVAYGAQASATPAQPSDLTPTPNSDEICDTILSRALSITEQRCSETGRNEACYGYTRVRAEYQPDVDVSGLRFEAVGDIVPVHSLARIQTGELSLKDRTWGMAILRLQASLPDTNPGQNVTFILFGDTSLSAAANETNAFYLSTELGELTCNQIPSSSLVVRAPGRVEVTFTLNDVEIRLASTLVFSAEGSILRAQVLEGHASVTVAGITRQMVAGQELTVPLDPATGEAAGPPSEPILFEFDPVLDTLSSLADGVSGETLDGPITLTGPIELIDADGGWITVDGRRIRIDPAQLARLRLGQPFTFTGYVRGAGVVRLAPTPTMTETLTETPQAPGPASAVPAVPPAPTHWPSFTPTFTATSTATDLPTPTETETPTEAPTETATSTSTPTRIGTPAPVALAALCSPDPAAQRVWSVSNSSAEDIAFTWNVRHSEFGQSGSGIAPAHGSFEFTTLTEQASNTVEIWVDGVLVDSHSGRADACR